jgi:hypothetical protein
MGTEILILFIPIPAIFLLRNVWRLRKQEFRLKSSIMILAGLLFIAYGCLPYTTHQYFMQGLMFTGFLYTPFYLISSVIVGYTLKRINHSKV